jgi:hypothetical protein
LWLPGAGNNRMVRIIKRTWTHPQDVNFIQWCFVMAELHESRPPPVGLFNIKILHVEHHHSSQNESNQLFSWPIHKQPNIYCVGCCVGLWLVGSSGASAFPQFDSLEAGSGRCRRRCCCCFPYFFFIFFYFICQLI